MGMQVRELSSGTRCIEARPDRAEPTGYGLVLGPDMIGLRACFEDLSVSLADSEGWVVVAPEPFPDHPNADVMERVALMGTTIDAKRQRDDIIRAADATGCERVGLLGFCMGGFLSYFAASTGRFESLVAMYGPTGFHGPLVGWRSGKNQLEPLEALEQHPISPLLAIIAGKDPGTPPEDVDRLRAIPGVGVVVYPDADHGFVHEPSREAHRPADAADAMARARRFLNSRGASDR